MKLIQDIILPWISYYYLILNTIADHTPGYIHIRQQIANQR